MNKNKFIFMTLACFSCCAYSQESSDFLVDPNTSTSLVAEESSPKTDISKAIKKNKAKLNALKKDSRTQQGLATIESKISSIISSPAFTSALEKMTTQEAESIANGESTGIIYEHSVSADFPGMANPNKMLVLVYSLLANIAHKEMLLSKLGSVNTTNSNSAIPLNSETTEEPSND